MSKEIKEKKVKVSKDKKKKTSLFWLMSVAVLTVGLLLFCQFFYGDSLTESSVFYKNTFVNGVDVSGMTKSEAKSAVEEKMLSNKGEISLTLKNGEESWQINGDDFEVKGDIEKEISNVLAYGRKGNIFEKKKIANKIKKEGLDVNISYTNILGGVNQKLDDIIGQVEKEAVVASIVFDPNADEMFSLSGQKNGFVVDRELLSKKIDEVLQAGFQGEVEIPFVEVVPDSDLESLVEKIGLRSSFVTNYSTSSADRKANVKKALSSFNGMIVEPGEEISFNKTTGPRTVETGYKKANIIVGGVYVSGAGGGVCQASTTLYNALLLADMEILEVNHHSLPASYVPLSFDAMVSEGYSDLVFKNNLDSAIYIKAYGTDTEAHIEIYGLPIEDKEIRTRAELVKVLGHSGDKIVTDTTGEYSNFVLYKGEYHRVKYPREGYESKGYVQYVVDGEVVEEKLVRHDHYSAQGGIIVEGSETLGEGMALPASNVKFIPPQKVTKESTESVRNKLQQTNPSAYNP